MDRLPRRILFTRRVLITCVWLLVAALLLLVSSKPVHARPGSETATGTVYGKATTQAGTVALSGARVSVYTSLSADEIAYATTQADGSYTLADLPLGSSYLVFKLSGYGTYITSFELATEGQSIEVNADLAVQGTVSGSIFQPDGVTPASGVKVIAFTKDMYMGYHHTAVSAADGSYSLLGLAAGNFLVMVSTDEGNFSPGSMDVSVTAGQQVTGVNFTRQIATQLSGQVTDSQGNPLASIGVQALKSDGGVYSTCTDANGQYSFTTLPADTAFTVSANETTSSCTLQQGLITQYWDHTTVRSQAVAITLTSQAPSQTANFVLGPGGGISGKIVHRQSGQGISQVCLRGYSAAQNGTLLFDSIKTSNDGSFSVWGLPAGSVYLRTDAKCAGGYPNSIDEWYTGSGSSSDPANAAPLVIVAGEMSSGISLSVTDTHLISGRLLDGSGNPAANTLVGLSDTGHRYGTCTDSQGYFRFLNVPYNHSLRLQAVTNGSATCGNGNVAYAQQYWQNVLTADQATLLELNETSPYISGLEFTLAPGGGISGHVYRQDGVTPLQGVCINVSDSASTYHEISHFYYTETDGSYWFWGIPSGTVYIRTDANCDGRYPTAINEWYTSGGGTQEMTQAQAVTIATGQMNSGIDFSILSGGVISGKVKDSSGNPLENIPVSLDGPGYGDGTCTGSNGEYTFNAAFNVNWRVRAMPLGENWCGGSTAFAQQYWPNATDWNSASQITLTAGDSIRSGVDFALQPGGGVSGFVYQADGTTSVANACINYYKKTGAGQLEKLGGWGKTGEDGSFFIAGFSPQTIYLKTDVNCESQDSFLIDEWYASGASVAQSDQAAAVTISPGSILDGINFQLDVGGGITGYVYQTGTNTPIANADVRVNLNDQNDTVARTTTDSQGYFQIRGLVPQNEYKIQAYASGYLRAFYPAAARWSTAEKVMVTAGVDTPGKDIHLVKADSTITGKVTYEDGSPVKNVWMEAFHSDGWFVGVNADANGNFSIPVIGGSWNVFPYNPPEYAPTQNVSVISGQTVNQVNFILHPAPVFSAIEPATVTQGSAEFVLTVTGSYFSNGFFVVLNQIELSTTFVDAHTLKATVPASALTSAGIARIKVVNPYTEDSGNGTFALIITPTATSGSVTTVVQTDSSATINFVAPQDPSIQTSISVPAGAVATETQLTYIENASTPANPQEGFVFGDRSFNLTAYVNGQAQTGYTFAKPVRLTLTYPEDLPESEQNTLMLYYWNESTQQWSSDGITLISRDPVNHQVEFEITHLSQFTLFSRGYHIYLPCSRK